MGSLGNACARARRAVRGAPVAARDEKLLLRNAVLSDNFDKLYELNTIFFKGVFLKTLYVSELSRFRINSII